MSIGHLNPLLRHVRRLASVTTGDSFSDAQLLARFQRDREESAFAALMRRHASLVWSVCRRVLGHEQDAEDAFQATFLVLARKADSIRNPEAVGPWLHGAAYRIAMRAKRDAAIRRKHEGKAPGAYASGSAEPELSLREGLAILDEEVERLGGKQRAVFIACCLEGRTMAEAAREMGWKEGTVSGTLFRAKERLRSRLARRGVTLSAALTVLALTEEATAAPAKLIMSTLQAALRYAAGGPAPAALAALIRGASKAMLFTKTKIAMLVLIVTSVAAAWGLASAPPAARGLADEKEPTNAKPQAAKDDAITITGRVLDPAGKPVAGAKLYAPHLKKEQPTSLDDIAWTKKAETDMDGKFRLPFSAKEFLGEMMRSYIVAAAEGHGVDWVELTKEEKPGELTLRLVKDAPIKGRLLDTQGKPLAGVKVRFSGVFAANDEKLDKFLTGWKQMWQDGLSQMSKRLYSTLDMVQPAATTDKDGRFEVRGAGVERLATLEISGPAVATSTLYVVVRPGFDPKPINEEVLSRIPAELRLPGQPPELYGTSLVHIATPTRTIEGTVRETDTGKPVSGVHILAIFGYGNGVNAVSDAQGHYKLTGIPKMKDYGLHAMPPKTTDLLARSVRQVDDGGLGTIQQDIELARGIVVTGQILDKETGKGVKGGVRFVPLPDNKFFGKKPGYDSYRFERLMTETQADGRFRVVIIPGSGVLMAQVNGGMKIDGLTLNPYKHAQFEPAERERAKPALNGDDWVYTAAGNSLEFLSSENAVKVLDLAEDAGSATANLSVDPGKTLKVHVQDADGKPLPGVIAAGVTASWPITFTLKDAECTACALDPEQPRRLVFLHPDRNLSGSLTARGDEKEPAVVRLKPTGSVTGRLLDLDGQPLAGVQIDPSGENRALSELYRQLRQQRPPVQTDKDGRFRVDGLVPDVKFSLSLNKGRTYFVGEPRIGLKEVAAGKTLDLGEVRIKPAR